MSKILILSVTLATLFMIQILNAQSSSESKPSFNCTKATTKAEKMICSDSIGELQNLDRYMGEIYTQLRRELKKANDTKRLDSILHSQRAFIKETKKTPTSHNLQDLYEDRIATLLQILSEVLDLNNKELCEYARKDRFDESKWQELPKSIKPPFSIGFCAFGANAQYGSFYDYCTQKGEMRQAEMAQAIREKSPYISFPKSYRRQIDIDNDGVPEDVILTVGEYFGVIWIYKNGKLDEKASDRIYGDDLHFHGAKTSEAIAMLNEVPYMAFTTYALPANKISQRLEFGGAEYPLLSYLSYGVMEFQGKTYITLYNRRFFDDEDFMYPTTRIYLLEGGKRELKCAY